MRKLSREGGQSTGEYAGTVLVASLLVVGLVTTDLGPTVAAALQDATPTVLGGGSTTDAAVTADTAGDDQVQVASGPPPPPPNQPPANPPPPNPRPPYQPPAGPRVMGPLERVRNVCIGILIGCANILNGNPRLAVPAVPPPSQRRNELEEVLENSEDRSRPNPGATPNPDDETFGPPRRAPRLRGVSPIFLLPGQIRYLEDIQRCGVSPCPANVDSFLPGGGELVALGGPAAIPAPPALPWNPQVLPPEQLGAALGTVAAGQPLDQTALDLLTGTVVPNAAGEIVDTGLEGIGATPVETEVAVGTTKVLVGSLFDDGVEIEQVAAAVVPPLVNDQFGGLLGDSGAPGAFAGRLILDGDVGAAAVDEGGRLVATAVPDIAPFVPLASKLILGQNVKAGDVAGPLVSVALTPALGPFAPIAGAAFGTVINAIDGPPPRIAVTEDLDLNGDGLDDEVEISTTGLGYVYTLDRGVETLPLDQVSFVLEERDVGIEAKARGDDSEYWSVVGRGNTNRVETEYFLSATYDYAPLYPHTEPARTQLGRDSMEGGAPRASAVDDDTGGLVTGYRITREDYERLRADLGATTVASESSGRGPGRYLVSTGTLAGGDPRSTALDRYRGEAGAARFTQPDTGQGVYFRDDLNGDGVQDVGRWFPALEGHVVGDNRVEQVSLGDSPVTRYSETSYSPSHYLALNPDVAASCAGSQACANAHFAAHGLQEARPASLAFDPRVYSALNPDLAGLSVDQLHAHYRSAGRAEQRVASLAATDLLFDPGYYAARWPDLAGLPTADLAAHYLTSGIAEGRQAAPSFDPTAYRANNPDLAGLSPTDLLLHYLRDGRTEPRVRTGG